MISGTPSGSRRRPARELVAGAADDGPVRAVDRHARDRARATCSWAWWASTSTAGAFAADALAAGAWGVLVAPVHAAGGCPAASCSRPDDPLAALQRLAQAWRRALDAAVIGVTGSVGKTSTKQLIAALVAPHRRVAANPANFNTEIGLPLAVLAAPEGTEVLVLEMGMRGFGQIDELARIAEPDVGVITNIGPGAPGARRLSGGGRAGEGRAAGARAVAVVPADAPELEPFLRAGSRRRALRHGRRSSRTSIRRGSRFSRASCACRLEVPFTARHQLVNLLAAVAAAQAVGVEPSGRVDVSFGALRGEHVALPSGAVLINDCYNANPLSMRAALDDLATQAPEGDVSPCSATCSSWARGGRSAPLLGAYAAASGVDVLVAVGPLSTLLSDAFDGECYAAPTRPRRRRWPREIVAPGRRRAGQGVARDRAGGRGGGAAPDG